MNVSMNDVHDIHVIFSAFADAVSFGPDVIWGRNALYVHARQHLLARFTVYLAPKRRVTTGRILSFSL